MALKRENAGRIAHVTQIWAEIPTVVVSEWAGLKLAIGGGFITIANACRWDLP